MLDPERLLGSMVKGALRGGRRRRSIGGAAVGMGLLGVAIAAVEHLSEKGRGQTAPRPTPPPPPVPRSGPPAVPPPPPPPLAAPGGVEERKARAMLLVRAMIAAAAADGEIDENERQRILERARGLGPDDREALERELEAPASRQQIAAAIDSPELAEEAYAASLLAIDVDTEAERAYLTALAGDLGLTQATVERVRALLGVDWNERGE